MKFLPETDHFGSGALAAHESRFEQPDIGPACETSVRTNFGRKLQQVFPLPPENSEPEDVRRLLRRIEPKLDGPPVPNKR
jgi:hypothetical protein